MFSCDAVIWDIWTLLHIWECAHRRGVDKHGMDATNDLTYMMLDAHVHTRLPCPWLAVRMHNNTRLQITYHGNQQTNQTRSMSRIICGNTQP